MRVWKTGERVEIGFAAKTVIGKVLLASSNGRSLMLEFDAMLGGYAGMMPVLEEGGQFRDLITRSIVVLSEPKE